MEAQFIEDFKKELTAINEKTSDDIAKSLSALVKGYRPVGPEREAFISGLSQASTFEDPLLNVSEGALSGDSFRLVESNYEEYLAFRETHLATLTSIIREESMEGLIKFRDAQERSEKAEAFFREMTYEILQDPEMIKKLAKILATLITLFNLSKYQKK